MRFYLEMLHDNLFVVISLATGFAGISAGNLCRSMNSMCGLEMEVQ
jgi:hypothetical protein